MPKSTIIGIDYGQKRVGLAVGNTIIRIAHPLKTVDNKLDPIINIIREWQAHIVVVGLPITTAGHMNTTCKDFAKRLYQAYPITIHLVDETLSSSMSESMLSAHKQIIQKKNKGKIDMFAAQIILQSYLDGQSYLNLVDEVSQSPAI